MLEDKRRQKTRNIDASRPMMSSDEYQITSEIHQEINRDSTEKPSLATENVVSRFPFKYALNIESSECGTNCGVMMDEDGDLIVCRKPVLMQKEGIIAIEHSYSTTLDLVGRQIWRGALLLGDFLLHYGSSLLQDHTVLELGSGVGFTSIVAAMFASEVICTVIYDNDVTEAFVNTLQRILRTPPDKTVYIALEKRYVFTVADFDSVAPCYEYFLQCLQKAQAKPLDSQWEVEQVPIDFPQYFNYERVKELVLWRIISKC
ncbi:methyltransferase-like protein 22 isoform X3 [Cryptotermes secundus]|uniref:methyltransferase-like protein 22 isoform X3 n=1 Tax=Cryptotermes secundus TaxID=105785 RepID=UPI000CD7DEE1|nr:methyltransferase-like protein 22 isoform X3 [Cryptotermes secundus]